MPATDEEEEEGELGRGGGRRPSVPPSGAPDAEDMPETDEEALARNYHALRSFVEALTYLSHKHLLEPPDTLTPPHPEEMQSLQIHIQANPTIVAELGSYFSTFRTLKKQSAFRPARSAFFSMSPAQVKTQRARWATCAPSCSSLRRRRRLYWAQARPRPGFAFCIRKPTLPPMRWAAGLDWALPSLPWSYRSTVVLRLANGITISGMVFGPLFIHDSGA